MTGSVVSEASTVYTALAYWRELIHAANSTWGGGVQWSPNKFFQIHEVFNQILDGSIGSYEPSPFKKCAAFAVAFMGDNYPMYGGFKSHPKIDLLKTQNHHVGAVLLYDYTRFCLDGAELDKGGELVRLKNPIKVSEHTYYDIIHALCMINKHGMACFSLLSLLLEQLAYAENPDASYGRSI